MQNYNSKELAERIITLISYSEPIVWVETEEIPRGMKIVRESLASYCLKKKGDKASDPAKDPKMFEYNFESGMYTFDWNWTPKKATEARPMGEPFLFLTKPDPLRGANATKQVNIASDPVELFSGILGNGMPQNSFILIPETGFLDAVRGNLPMNAALSEIILRSTENITYTDSRSRTKDGAVASSTLQKKLITIIIVGSRPTHGCIHDYARNNINWNRLGRPTREEHAAVITYEYAFRSKEEKEKTIKLNGGEKDLEKLSLLLGENLLGLTAFEANSALFYSLATVGAFDPTLLSSFRKELINSTPGLSLEAYDASKDWKRVKGAEKIEEVTERMLQKKQAILLVGPPGCGKTMIMSAIAQKMRLMYIKMNIGAMMGGVMGQSERQLNTALSVISSLGRVIVGIDEAEKQLSGTVNQGKSGASDVTERMGAALLAWENDRTCDAIVIKTANRPDNLAAEMIRRSRLKIFVDLPLKAARREILKMHIADEGLTVSEDLLTELTKDTTGWSGDEIKALVEIAAQFGGGKGGFSKAHDYTKPLYATMPEDVRSQRASGKRLGTYLSEVSFEEDAGDDLPEQLREKDTTSSSVPGAGDV